MGANRTVRRVTKTMRAARFLGGGRIELDEVAVPEPGPDEVLVKVHSCALCGTDRGAYRDGSPVTPGHEASGTVVATGRDVTDLDEGSPGVVYLVDFCGGWSACRAGSTNMCLKRRKMYGFTADGGFADFEVVRSGCFLPIGNDVPLDLATTVLDFYGTSLHAFRRAGPPGPKVVGIVGCGPIGLGAISVANALGAALVYGIDVAPYRLELAARLGAVPVDARAGDAAEIVLKESPGGCDVVIEAAGISATQRQAIELSAPGGRVVFVAHNREPLEVHTLTELIALERTLLGSEYFPIAALSDTYALVASGAVDAASAVTHRYSLERIGDAFEAFWSGATAKVLVQP